jgi:DNA-binding XRE family transcriptional regulator
MESDVEISEEDTEPNATVFENKEENLVEALDEIKPRKGYYIMEIPVVVTTYQRIEVSLTEYIGRKVTTIRQERGLTQLQLANLTGKLSQTAISTVESGVGNPQLMSLQLIADAFGMDLMELMPTV